MSIGRVGYTNEARVPIGRVLGTPEGCDVKMKNLCTTPEAVMSKESKMTTREVLLSMGRLNTTR